MIRPDRAGRRRGACIALALLAAASSLPRPAAAWGREGHEIVALIAAHYLTAAARTRIDALLATDRSGLVRGTGIAAESTWADRYRDSDRHGGGRRGRRTGAWHYVNLELARPSLRTACYGERPLPPGIPASSGPAHDCVVDKIEQFDRELRAAATPARERLRALQYLLHLVGDLHQPLHCADDRDRGGNAERVALPGGGATSLHRAWDTVFVADLGRSPRRVADALIRGIAPARARAWRAGTPARWAFESHAIAAHVAYGALPSRGAGGRYRLSPRYVSAADAAVRVQLERAGVRLAALLNADLG